MAAKKPAAKKRSSSSTYQRTNAPRRPAQVRSPQDAVRDKEILGIVLITASLLLLVNFILAPQPAEADVSAIGVVSLFFVRLLRFFAGGGAVALPIFMLLFGVFVVADRQSPSASRLAGLLLLFLAILGFIQLNAELTAVKAYFGVAAAGAGGGVLGALIDIMLLKTIGRVGCIIVLCALLLIGLLLALQTSLTELVAHVASVWRRLRELMAFHQPEPERPQPVETPPARRVTAPLISDPVSKPAPDSTPEPAVENSLRDVPIFNHDEADPVITQVEDKQPATPLPPKNRFVMNFMPDISEKKEVEEVGQRPQIDPSIPGQAEQPAPDEADEVAEEAPEPDNIITLPVRQTRPAIKVTPPREPAEEKPAAPAPTPPQYILPSPELIDPGLKVKNTRLNKTITENIGVLENTLENFGVKATVTQVVAGPSVTRYELQPAPGVKVAKITSLTDDIALSLAAQGVRIEAPIPGKSAIGIEVARKERDTVYFREMIDSEDFQESKALLSFVLGKNIGGENIIGNLAKMPHLLIAGSTGSGKSVCLNTIICSLLFKARPDQVKLMLIDPKKVEMTQYARLPHLIAPVVNDSKKAANALKWVVNEMEARYSLFAGAACKDFDGYNKAHADDPLPHIVVIIDELADLMMVARHDVEDSICRLAQMARAAGIHLVVATQRPSVDVITGLIKANIPSRIAFTVSSYTDSRTILDMGGAEKLLGYGDMLYAPIGKNKPERIQGTFIDEKDVIRLVDYCSEQASPSFTQAAVQAAENGASANGNGRDEEVDELLYDAAMLIISTGQASTSFLQRRLAVGNPRAARLMDTLEAKGVVGCSKGAKPRDILMTAEEVEALLGA